MGISASGQESKEDDKPCVTSVTINRLLDLKKLSTKNFTSFKQVVCKRPENVNFSEDHDKTLKLLGMMMEFASVSFFLENPYY